MQSDFLWLGNRLAVDFVNTEVVVRGEPVDLLAQPCDFLDWLGGAGFAEAASARLPERERARLLPEAKRYRARLRKSFAASATAAPELLVATNTLLARCDSAPELVEDDGRCTLRTRFRFTAAESFLAPVAQSAAELLAHDDLRRLRKCSNPQCVLYFYDTSKSGARSWCSLDLCGNRSRMAASRKRRGLS